MGDKAALGFLSNPVAPVEKKKDLLKTIGGESDYSPITSNFLNLLVDKARIKYLPEICEAFESLYCENTDTETATVVSLGQARLGAAAEHREAAPAPDRAQKHQAQAPGRREPARRLRAQVREGRIHADWLSIKGQLEKIEEDLMTSAPSM